MLYRKAKSMVDAIYSQLIQDLSAVYSPRHHIIRMMDLDGLVEQRSREASTMFEQELAQNRKMVEGNIAILKGLAIKRTKLEQSVEQCEGDLHHLKRLNCEKPFVRMFPDWSERTGTQRVVSSLRSEFMLAADKLSNAYDHLKKELHKSLQLKVQMTGQLEQVHQATAGLSERMNDQLSLAKEQHTELLTALREEKNGIAVTRKIMYGLLAAILVAEVVRFVIGG